MLTRLKWFTLSLCFCGTPLFAASGGITLGGTRLIYEGGKKEASINVSNSDTTPYLIQSWAENADGKNRAPFVVTPPLFRLDAGKQNALRIVYTGTPLPADRESLYWLNVKSIPSGTMSSSANTLQIAVKTRIKLIYRPKGLRGGPDHVDDALRWQQNGTRLTVTNPTPFYMNFQEVRVGGREVKDATLVAPMSSATFTAPAGSSGTVTWKVITDYGGSGAVRTTAR